MIGTFRKFIQSWVGLAVLGLALAAMVVTLFYGQTVGPAPVDATAVARVGDAQVSQAEVLRAVNAALERQREQTPQMTMPEFVRLGGADLVLEQLILARALQQFGATNGVPVGKRVIDGEIASLPMVQVGGKFDTNAYQRFLDQQQLSEAELRDTIASDLMRRMVLVPAAFGTRVPDGMARPYADLLLEQRSGTILPVPVELMPVPPAPDDKVLADFWAKNRAAWTVPERRTFRFAMLSQAALAAAAEPSDKEVADYYAAHPQEFGGVEQRVLSQVVLPDESRARAFAGRVAQGQSFGEAAGAEGFSGEDVRIGTVSEAAFASQTSPAVASAAFAVAQGAITAPVKGPIGWHVVQVDGIVPKNPVPLADARAAIAGKLRIDKMQKVLAERVDAIEDRLESGETLADVAKAFGMTIENFGPVTADSQALDPSDQLVPVPGNPLTARAFASDPEDGPAVVEYAQDRFAVLEVTDVVPPAPIPLERIRDRVAAAWAIDTRTRAAETLARRLAEEASKGADLAALAREAGMPAPQALTVQRLQLSQLAQSGQQIPAPVLMLLNVPPGQARVVAAPGSQAWFVVRTDGAVPGDAAGAPQLVDAVRQGMARDAPNELAETFARAVQRSVGVVRQPAAIAAVKRRLSGEGGSDLEGQ